MWWGWSRRFEIIGDGDEAGNLQLQVMVMKQEIKVLGDGDDVGDFQL